MVITQTLFNISDLRPIKFLHSIDNNLFLNLVQRRQREYHYGFTRHAKPQKVHNKYSIGNLCLCLSQMAVFANLFGKLIS